MLEHNNAGVQCGEYNREGDRKHIAADVYKL